MKKFKDWFLSTDWKGVSPSVYVRYVMSAVVAINTILTLLNINPISVEEGNVQTLLTIILSLITIFVAVYNTYKNNSTSREAMMGDFVKDLLKGMADASEKEEAIDKLTTFLSSMQDAVTENTTEESSEETSTEETTESDETDKTEEVTNETSES